MNCRLTQLVRKLSPALAMWLLLASMATACPNCKEALANSGGSHGDLARGFYYSILFMLAMPFTVVGAFSAYMYREVLRARAAQGKSHSPVET